MSSAPPSRRRGDDIQELLRAVATSDTSDDDDDDKGVVPHTKISSTAAQPVNVGQPLARSTDGGNRGAVANTTTNAKNYLAVSEFSSDSDDGGSNVASHQRRSASAATVRGASLASTALPPPTTTAGSSTSSIPAAAAAASRRMRHMHNNGALSHVSSDDDDEHTAAPIRSTSIGAESAAAPNSGAGAASGGGSRHGGGFRLGSGVHTVSASRRQELHALQLSDDSDDNDDGNDPTMIVHGTAGSSSKAAQSHNTTLNTTVDPTPTPTYLHPGEAVAVADLRGEALVAAIEDANARYRTKRGSGGGRQTTISTVEVFETSTTSVVSRGAKSTTQEIASTTTTTVARAVASHGGGTSSNRSVVHQDEARDEDDRSAVTDEILNVSAVGGGGASAAASAASTAAPTDHNETAPPPVGGSGPMPPQQQRASTPTQHHSRSSSKMMANSDDDLFRADDLRIQPYQPKDEGVDEAQYAGRGGAVVGVGSGDAVKTDEVNIALTATSSTAMSPSPRDEFPRMYADASSRGGVERVGGATRQPTAGSGGAPSSSGAAVVGQQRTTLQRNDDSSLSFVQDDEDSLLNVSGIPPSHISTAAAGRGAVTGAKKSISPSLSVTGRQRQPLLSLSTAAITKKGRQERSGNHSALREGSALSEGRADTTVNSIQFELDGSLAHHPRGSHFDPMQEDRTSLVFSPAPDLASSSLVFTTGTSPNDGSLPTSPGQRRGGRGGSGTGATSAGGRQISPPPEADLNNPQPHATHKGSRPSSTTTTLKANGASSKVSAPLPPPPPRPQYVPQHQQRSSSSSSALRVMYDQAVRKRMYTNAKHEQLRAASAHVEMKECTFAPKITVKGSRAVSSAQQQQQRPPNSARLVSVSASVGDVNDEGVGGADRPQNDNPNSSAQRRQRLLHEARGVERDGDLAECTFAPKVEPISAALVQRAREQAQAANTPLPTTTERLHLDSKRRAVELAHNTEISLKELRGSRPATKRSEDAIMSHVESLQRFQQRREETIQRLTQEEEQRHQRPSTQVKSNELLVDPDAVVHRLLHRAPSSSRGTADESNASAATMTAPQVNAVSRELALRRRETMLSEWFTALSGGVPMQTRGVDIAELDLVALFTVAQQPPLLGLGTSHAESPGRNTSVSPSRSASAPVSEVSSLTTSGSHQALARSLSTLRRTDEFHSIVAALLDYQRTRPATAPLPTSSSVNHNNEIVGGGGGMSSWWLTFAQFRAILHRVEHRGGPQLWSRRGPQQAIAHYREQQEQLNPTSRSATTEMRGDKEDEARIFQRLFSHQTCATWQKHKGIAGGNSAAAASYAILDKEHQLHDHRTHGGDMEASGRRRMCSVAALEAHKAELSFAVAEEMNSSGYVEAWQPTKGEQHDQTYAASPRDIEETKRHQSHALLKRRLEDNVVALDEEENESIDALLASLDAVVATRRHNKDMPSEVRPTYDGDHHHHHHHHHHHRAPHDVDDPRGFQTPPPQTHDDDVSYVVLSPVPPPAAPPLAAAGQLDKIVAAASPSSSGSLAVVTVRGAPTTANKDKVVSVDGCEDLLLACAAANSSLVANSSSTQKKITTQRKLDLVEVTTTTTTTTTRRTGTANTATNVFYNTVKSTAATATTTTSGSAVVAVDMGGGNQQQHHAGGRIAASFISAREQRQAEEKRRLRELGKRLATVAVAGVR